MHTDWRCDADGVVPPLHVPVHVGADILSSALGTMRSAQDGHRRPPPPVWCMWPAQLGWTVTGVGWVGDDRTGVRATALACSGPSPLRGGPADILLIAEEPGVGLGNRYGGIPGLDPGDLLTDVMSDVAPPAGDHGLAHAKIKVGGHPTPLWSVKSPNDRSAYVGEARGMWLYAIAWPASAGYLLAENVILHDLTEWLPPELVYGAPSSYLHEGA